VLLGSAMVYPTLLAAIGDVAHAIWRGPAGGTSSRLGRVQVAVRGARAMPRVRSTVKYSREFLMMPRWCYRSNHLARRIAPKSALSAAYSVLGPSSGAVGPPSARKYTSTRPTSPSPISTKHRPVPS
jgi:hypothetical protein